MVVLAIKVEDIKKHLESSINATKRKPVFSQNDLKEIPVGIWLVKDAGSYIMSNSCENKGFDYIYCSNDDCATFRIVDGKDWELQQSIDGDDFVEFLDETFCSIAIEHSQEGYALVDFDKSGMGVVTIDNYHLVKKDDIIVTELNN